MCTDIISIICLYDADTLSVLLYLQIQFFVNYEEQQTLQENCQTQIFFVVVCAQIVISTNSYNCRCLSSAEIRINGVK